MMAKSPRQVDLWREPSGAAGPRCSPAALRAVLIDKGAAPLPGQRRTGKNAGSGANRSGKTGAPGKYEENR